MLFTAIAIITLFSSDITLSSDEASILTSLTQLGFPIGGKQSNTLQTCCLGTRKEIKTIFAFKTNSRYKVHNYKLTPTRSNV